MLNVCLPTVNVCLSMLNVRLPMVNVKYMGASLPFDAGCYDKPWGGDEFLVTNYLDLRNYAVSLQ